MKLIDNWRAAPRMVSMWCYAATGGVILGWLTVPWEIQQPTMLLLLALQLVGAVGRLVAQPGLVEDIMAGRADD